MNHNDQFTLMETLVICSFATFSGRRQAHAWLYPGGATTLSRRETRFHIPLHLGLDFRLRQPSGWDRVTFADWWTAAISPPDPILNRTLGGAHTRSPGSLMIRVLAFGPAPPLSPFFHASLSFTWNVPSGPVPLYGNMFPLPHQKGKKKKLN